MQTISDQLFSRATAGTLLPPVFWKTNQPNSDITWLGLRHAFVQTRLACSPCQKPLGHFADFRQNIFPLCIRHKASMHSSNRIQCNDIAYRQGYIEILPNIHEGHINIETWMVAPENSMSNRDVDFDLLRDDQFIGNTEIEMSIENAERLVRLLQAAIFNVKNRSQNT